MVIGITDLSNGSHYLKVQLNSEFDLDELGMHNMNEESDLWVDTAFEYNSDDNYAISIPFYNNRK